MFVVWSIMQILAEMVVYFPYKGASGLSISRSSSSLFRADPNQVLRDQRPVLRQTLRRTLAGVRFGLGVLVHVGDLHCCRGRRWCHPTRLLADTRPVSCMDRHLSSADSQPQSLRSRLLRGG